MCKRETCYPHDHVKACIHQWPGRGDSIRTLISPLPAKMKPLTSTSQNPVGFADWHRKRAPSKQSKSVDVSENGKIHRGNLIPYFSDISDDPLQELTSPTNSARISAISDENQEPQFVALEAESEVIDSPETAESSLQQKIDEESGESDVIRSGKLYVEVGVDMLRETRSRAMKYSDLDRQSKKFLEILLALDDLELGPEEPYEIRARHWGKIHVGYLVVLHVLLLWSVWFRLVGFRDSDSIWDQPPPPPT